MISAPFLGIPNMPFCLGLKAGLPLLDHESWSWAQPGCCASSVALSNSKSGVSHLNSTWPLNREPPQDPQPWALLVLTSSIRNVLLDFRGMTALKKMSWPLATVHICVWLRFILQPKANFILSRLDFCRWQFLGSVLEDFWQDWHQVCYAAFLKCKIGFFWNEFCLHVLVTTENVGSSGARNLKCQNTGWKYKYLNSFLKNWYFHC